MKVYEGERGLEGARVTVDGVPLPAREDIQRCSWTGFEWGFIGPGPQQLALALLADHLGDAGRARQLSRPFMRKVVAQLDNAWVMNADDIANGLREIGALP
jgi:hypothetical protein